jgi:acetoacetate decarboxylase
MKDRKTLPTFKQSLGRITRPMARGTRLWENARFVLADVPLDKKETKKILPWCMGLGSNPTATLFIVDYTKTSFTVPYHEAALLVHVKTPLGKGLHCPWMVVDDDTAMIYGREILGYPKKKADIVFEENNGNITAGVTRRGVEVLRIESTSKARQASPPPVFDCKTFNVGGPLQFFSLLQPIWLFRPKEEIHESYETEARVLINDSEYDPIARLIDGEPFNTRMVVLDIIKGRYFLFAGLAGGFWYVHSYYLRYR